MTPRRALRAGKQPSRSPASTPDAPRRCTDAQRDEDEREDRRGHQGVRHRTATTLGEQPRPVEGELRDIRGQVEQVHQAVRHQEHTDHDPKHDDHRHDLPRSIHCRTDSRPRPGGVVDIRPASCVLACWVRTEIALLNQPEAPTEAELVYLASAGLGHARRAPQPARAPPNTCHASTDLAVRLKKTYAFSPNR